MELIDVYFNESSDLMQTIPKNMCEMERSLVFVIKTKICYKVMCPDLKSDFYLIKLLSALLFPRS